MADKIPHLIAEMRRIHDLTRDWASIPRTYANSQEETATRQHMTVIADAMKVYYECYENWSATMAAVALSMPAGDASSVAFPIKKPTRDDEMVYYDNVDHVIRREIDGPHGTAALMRFENLMMVFAAPVMYRRLRRERQISGGVNPRNMLISTIKRLRTLMSDQYAMGYINSEDSKAILDSMCGPIATADKLAYIRDSNADKGAGASASAGADGDLEYVSGLLNGPVASAMITPSGEIKHIAGNIADDAKFRQHCSDIWHGLGEDSRAKCVVVTLVAYNL